MLNTNAFRKIIVASLFLFTTEYSVGAGLPNHGVYVQSVKGDKSGPNQDVSDITILEDRIIAYVADGHGLKGEVHASISGNLFLEFASVAKQDNSSPELFEGIFKAIDLTLYKTLQSGEPLKSGGTTLTSLIAFLDKDQSISKVQIGYVGDSMAVISTKDPEEAAPDIFFTKDHDFAKNIGEVQRYDAQGFSPVALQKNLQMVRYFEVNFLRQGKTMEQFLELYPFYMRDIAQSQITGKLHCSKSGPNMSRSLGDFLAKDDVKALIPTPDVYDIELKGETVVILASDGLWEIVSAEEAVKLCWEMQTLHKQPDQAAEAAAKALVSLVQSRASKHSYATDDTTVQVLFLNI